MDDWLDLKAAADLMGYTPAYFRRIYCDSDHPLVVIRERIGPKGGRRIGVNAADLDRILEARIKRPCGSANEAR